METTVENNTLFGYRSEFLFGEGYRGIKEVVHHETFTLGNSDIPEYVLKHYEHLLTSEERMFLHDIMNAEVDEDPDNYLGDICFNVAKKITGSENPECIWLCASKKDVICSYDYHNELLNEDIDTYLIPTNHCILTNLGEEGALYAFEKVNAAIVK